MYGPKGQSLKKNRRYQKIRISSPSISKKLIICEKPSVAHTYADVLGVNGKDKGFIENDTWIITWCVGHLVTLSYPEVYDETLKKWDIETLPFLPKYYKYEVISSVKEQFYTVKKLLNRKDLSEILYAGDPAREGLYIQCLVREQAGHYSKAEEKVVWIDSQTPEEIKRGIKEAKPLKSYRYLRDAGYMRAIEDYALGINFSRILTLKYGTLVNNAAGTSKDIPLAIGRVMTCVLAMVVERERAISEFVETPFYKISNIVTSPDGKARGEWKVSESSKLNGSPKLYNDTGFLKREDAEQFINQLPSKIKIVNVERSIEKKNAPFLFNLAELQFECSKRYKISPDETLAIVQELYEKKLTTYPRTDARVLSTAIAIEIGNNIRGLKGYDKAYDWAKHIYDNNLYKNIADTKYTDDSKISDHYAIIPTGQSLDKLSSCSPTAQAVFELIVKRFLAIFLPSAEYTKVKVTEDADGEMFYAYAKKLTKKGYLALYGIEEDNEERDDNRVEVLASLPKGMELSSKYSLEECKTTPPKRYTSGSMILAMENAGRLIEEPELRAQIKSCGIGTSATRDSIIKKLVKLGYINLNQKTQILTPNTIGNLVYQVVHKTIPSLLNPRMTASWEKGLSEIENGNVSIETYREKLETYIRNEVEKLKKNDFDMEVVSALKLYSKVSDFENVQRKSYKGENSSKSSYSVKVLAYIDVPYEEKDEAKKLGARFDMKAKKWYIPEGISVDKFKKWKNISKKQVSSSNDKIYIKVPYSEKDEAKSLGAKFDTKKKSWYIYKESDMTLFAKWK